MFYFENFLGKKVLKSDYITEINAFFTTREGFDFTNLNSVRVLTPEQTHTNNVHQSEFKNAAKVFIT